MSERCEGFGWTIGRGLTRVRAVGLTALLLAVGAGGGAAQERALPFGADGWVPGGDATAIEAADGADGIRLRNGSVARLDLPVRDGTFDFDLALPGARGFVGLRFRLDAEGNAEEVYFRAHKSGQPDVLQYAPVFGGESYWQVFHGPAATAAVSLPEPGEWLHVRVVVAGRTAAVYLDGSAEPALVARLAREPAAGFFAFYASVPPAPGAEAASAVVANVKVSDAPPPDVPTAPAAVRPTGTVVECWELSPAFAWSGALPAEATGERPGDPGDPAWSAATADEDSGLLLVGRYRSLIPGSRGWAVRARFTILAETAGRRRLDLGFSDAVTVLHDGAPVFAADHGFSPNFPRRQGLVTPGQASLFLPLEAGPNDIEVVLADRMGGWAVIASLPDTAGVRVDREPCR